MTRAAIAALAIAFAAPAHAEPSRDVPREAREKAERGRTLHAAGDYTGAVAAFRRAYELAPSPGLLFNLAQSYRLAGECDEAAAMYRRFLASAPPGAERTLAERHLATVARCGHTRVASSSESAAIGASVGAVAMAPTSPSAQAHVPMPMELAPTVVAPAPRIARRSGRRDKQIGLGLLVGGGTALVVAGFFALDADAAAHAVSAAYADERASGTSAIDARGQNSADIARVLGVGGVLALATGAVFYAVGVRLDKDAAEARRFAVMPTRHGAEVKLAWRF
jgi:tetratricopeptide (TPR) repeat protein